MLQRCVLLGSVLALLAACGALPAVQAGNVHVLTADNGIEGYWTTPFLIEEFLTQLEQ